MQLCIAQSLHLGFCCAPPCALLKLARCSGLELVLRRYCAVASSGAQLRVGTDNDPASAMYHNPCKQGIDTASERSG